MGNKIGFENVSYSNMLIIQAVNDKNGSILFIDLKTKIPNVTTEDINAANALLDYSTMIMDQLNLNHTNYANNEEYKNKLIEIIKKYSIKITTGTLQYLIDEGFQEFEKVLKSLLKYTNNNTINSINEKFKVDLNSDSNINDNNDNNINYNDSEVIEWEKASSKYQPIIFDNIQIIDTLDKNIFSNCLIPSLEGNNTKKLNDKEIKDSSYINKFQIQRIVKLNLKQYNYFINNLLHDYAFLTGLGGWNEDEQQNLLYYYGVAIVCNNQETLIIDPECSSFAKYTCQLIEDINDSLQTELNNINTTLQINNNLYIEAINSIVNTQLYEIKVSDKTVINDNRFIKNISYNGLTVITDLTMRELIEEQKGIDILNLQPLHINIELFKEGLIKHDKGQIFSLFPTETDKQLEKIKFVNRLEFELSRVKTETFSKAM